MKHNLLLPLATTTTLLLLLLFSTANGDDYVYDVDQNQLVKDGTFHIVPYGYAAVGGGFSYKQDNNNYYIYQLENNRDFGLNITFNPVVNEDKQQAITLSSEINIEFPDVNLPSTSSVWKVENDKDVLLGGTKGGTDRKSVFTIEGRQEKDGYIINYCTSATTCGGLGIDPSSGPLRKLVVNAPEPLVVVFEPTQFFTVKSSIFAA